MNLSKCKNGHFYDGSIYQSCPHCSMSGDSKTIMAEGDLISPDMFPKQNVPHPPIPPIGGVMAGQMNRTLPGTQQMPSQMNQAVQKVPPMPGMPPVPPTPPSGMPSQIPQAPQGNMPSQIPQVPQGNMPSQMPQAPAASGQVSVMPDVDNLKDNIKFPVGFVVCISGENRGDSYRLKPYDNYIGRKSENEICLDKDISVSRIKHANIYYSPETNEFWIMHGESKQAIHLKAADAAGCITSGPGELVQDKCKLNAYDEIVIGKSIIKFIPLCGRGFSW